jgi:hypothetical protein
LIYFFISALEFLFIELDAVFQYNIVLLDPNLNDMGSKLGNKQRKVSDWRVSLIFGLSDPLCYYSVRFCGPNS